MAGDSGRALGPTHGVVAAEMTLSAEQFDARNVTARTVFAHFLKYVRLLYIRTFSFKRKNRQQLKIR